jgi:lysine N6-hydroxylase
VNKQHLIGIGIGPFNLSLAALLKKTPQINNLFLEKKQHFDWHPEVMFSDSVMQTSYLKDLVTPVDPTNPHSFLNYLVEKNLFYPFLNTQRSVVSRKEFELYCAWVAEKLQGQLQFNTDVYNVSFIEDHFQIETSQGRYDAENICVATGLIPRIPDFAKILLGSKVFHAKSPQLRDLNLENKSVVIVGGGQTGVEVFRNALQNKWGKAAEINLVTRRKSLEPLDESAFTNDYFTPNYVNKFWDLSLEKKSQIVASQKLASDGNTPEYLSQLYNDLYRLKHVDNDSRRINILACRRLNKLTALESAYVLGMENTFLDRQEEMKADIIILCTGFQSAIPSILKPLLPQIKFDHEGRFIFNKNYSIEWSGPASHRIYALNFSRHNHGIMDPQTSLMAWRSATVVNDLAQSKVYTTEQTFQNFVEYDLPV